MLRNSSHACNYLYCKSQQLSHNKRGTRIRGRQKFSIKNFCRKDYYQALSAKIASFISEKMSTVRNSQDLKFQEQFDSIAHRARVYADVTRSYAQDDANSKQILAAICAFLVLLYYYSQSAKSRALYRDLEKARCDEIDQLTRIQKSAARSKEKLQLDLSSRENQLGLLQAQNSEQMNVIDRLTSSLKYCSFQGRNEN